MNRTINFCRFTKTDLYHLLQLFGIPPEIVLPDRHKISGEEAFIIFLCRLAYPNRLSHLVPVFGRSESYISRVVNFILDFLYNKYEHLIRNIDQPYLDLQHMADAVASIAPLKNCIGFVDGTVRGMCRPTYDQRVCFNGHKRKHAIKFQGLMAPNGLFIAMHGPYAGRRHDAFIFGESGIEGQLVNLPRMADGTRYCIYGDAGYGRLGQLVAPYRGNQLTPEQERFNRAMSGARQSVEFGFGKIEKYWAFCDFKKNLKLYLQPIGKYYLVATLLTNCHTCLYRSNINSLFDSQPPTIDQYLGN